MSGTYPGSSYPGPSTFPGGDPAQGSATLLLTASPTLTLGVVQRGSATLTFTADAVLRIGGPTRGFATLALTASPSLTFKQFGSKSSNPSIAAFAEPGNVPPRVLLQASNITGPSAQVLRYGPDGLATPVRSGDLAPLNSGSWVGYDYEAPYNVPVYYVIRPTSGTPAQQSPPVTLAASRPWLVHPGVPDLSMPVTVKVLGDETTASGGSLHPIVGRATSIPITDGRRKAPTFELQIKSATSGERDRLDQLFLDNAPLLLQVVYPRQTAERVYRWIFIGDIVKARKGSAFGDTARVWTLPCTEVDRPEGGIRAQRSWADLMAECATWRDVIARYKTWRGVLTGIEGT